MQEFHHQIEDKLIILYVLNKIKTGLTREQLAYIIIQNLQISYFDIQMYVDTLIKENLVKEQAIDPQPDHLIISPEGSQMVSHLLHKIPDYIQEILDAFIKNNKNAITNETITDATYEKNGPDDFQVQLTLTENNIKLMQISINSPTQDQAVAICENWKQNTQKIYASIMKDLISSYY
ncbi:MAG: DUF4364 family protein [Eubacteriaceae bacterium]|nr:DUF4364 family protein [Eubacteriaceae bacterium]